MGRCGMKRRSLVGKVREVSESPGQGRENQDKIVLKMLREIHSL